MRSIAAISRRRRALRARLTPVLGLAAVTALALGGCGGGSSTSATTSPGTGTPASAAATTPPFHRRASP